MKSAAIIDRRSLPADFLLSAAEHPIIGPLVQAPCLTCPVEHLCGDDPVNHKVNPQTCQPLAEWVEWSRGYSSQIKMLKFRHATAVKKPVVVVKGQGRKLSPKPRKASILPRKSSRRS